MRYEYECPKHGEFEIVCSVHEHQNPYPCPSLAFTVEHGFCGSQLCGELSPQLFSANVFMQPDIWDNHYVEAVDKVFTSKAKMKDYMEHNHLRQWEPGVDADINRNKEYAQERQDRARLKVIEKAVEDL